MYSKIKPFLREVPKSIYFNANKISLKSFRIFLITAGFKLLTINDYKLLNLLNDQSLRNCIITLNYIYLYLKYLLKMSSNVSLLQYSDKQNLQNLYKYTL